VLLLLLLALIAVALFSAGLVIHWLFVVAVVVALVWLIGFFAGGLGGRSRRAWW
jgi:hypothetical protein